MFDFNPLIATSDVTRSLLTHHFTSGNCFGNPGTACRNTVADLIHGNCILTNRTQFQIYLMSLLVKSFTLRTLRRIFNVQNIYHESSFTLSKFRHELRKFITRLGKGKSEEDKRAAIIEAEKEIDQERRKLHESWPQIVSKALKDKVAQIFKQAQCMLHISRDHSSTRIIEK